MEPETAIAEDLAVTGTKHSLARQTDPTTSISLNSKRIIELTISQILIQQAVQKLRGKKAGTETQKANQINNFKPN
ncbi:hypothetical protein [Cylindrospermopsis raciborskii]|uniref:hypothetical protein n=1 Tax=Cylindrospermopsis raciborskii TaxID=77022 RepID=UPI000778B7AA|nr:hypothetical protein [Cylindrospermopsis raciborskii]MCZ2207196.1 hypothetical protein [Cylindrospermopsis raciborskii PAMP2011]